MKKLDVKSKSIKWINALELETTERGGIIPLRYKKSEISRMDKMIPIARMSTSIELQVQGRFRKIEITLRLVNSDGFGFAGEWRWGHFKVLPHWRLENDFTKIQKLSAGLPPAPEKNCPLRLLLPTHCEIEFLEIHTDETPDEDFKTYDYSQIPGAKALRWLVYGDSITQGANCSTPSNTWVDIVSRKLGLKTTNIAIGGHGRAELVIAEAIAARNDFDMLSLHMGANALNEMEFAERLKKFILIIREKHPSEKIFVATPIIHIPENFFDSISDKLRDTRLRMGKSVMELQNSGDENLHLLDGNKILGDTRGMLRDMVHLDDFGMSRYAGNLMKLMAPFLK
ncbi:MAG: hypothetical protein A2017_16680 [Lentisphaerae bacterium GWF2_44_16]|nr:MAG: hypothetical protein A2017_16680 [Lentisphaerae bacterium GWF2_44_16]